MFDFLSDKFSTIFSRLVGTDKLSEGNIEEVLQKVQDLLLEADVPYNVVQRFIAQVKEEAVGQKVLKSLNPAEQFVKIIYERLVDFLSTAGKEGDFELPASATIMVMGLQGSGKTTSIGKLAYFLKKKGFKKNILVGSVDFYRPAAVDQLEILAKQAGVDFYRAQSKSTIEAAREIQQKFNDGNYDLLMLDTAGRLHVDNEMLQELKDLDSIIRPSKKLLVLDAMTGQESINVAKAFGQAVSFDGALLTKTDSDTRAGASFAFAYALKKPILFVGTGEKIDDLAKFYPDRAAKRILGMGDIDSLLERADEQIKKEDQEAAAKAFMSGDFSLDDFAKQMDMMKKIGSLGNILKFLPGMGGLAGQLSPDKVAQGEDEMKRFRVIINSMTEDERRSPALINKTRIARIAKGAGVTQADVRALLQKFEQSKQFVKLLKKNKSFGNFFK